MPACTHVTMPTPPNRRRSASAYASSADNAAAGMLPAGASQIDAASGASRTTSAMNRRAIRDAEPANARNQPRTVDTGRPSDTAIFRYPCPAENFASIAAAITAAASARRAASNTSSST